MNQPNNKSFQLNILSVDDEPDMELLISQIFRSEIRSNKYRFFFASNGLIALEKLQSNPEINLLLVDINMPVMDGLTLLKSVVAQNNPLLKVVIISAYGDMDNIRQAMNLGAYDFVTKPIDFSDLKLTIDKAETEIHYLLRKQKQSQRLKTLEADVQAGAIIQNSLLPDLDLIRKRFPTLQIADLYSPAKTVGGDFYDIFVLPDGKLGVIVADVSGKGIPAAAFMLICHTATTIFANQNSNPSRIFSKVNSYLVAHNSQSMFVTALLMIFDIENKKLFISNAGHNKPFIVNNQNVVEMNLPSNVVLGIIPDYDFEDVEMDFEPNQTFFLYTDGLSDAVDKNGNIFGIDRIHLCLESCKNLPVYQLVNTLKTEVDNFSAGLEPFDDITLVGLRFEH